MGLNVLPPVGLEVQAIDTMLATNRDLSYDELERLRQFDTCTLSNAIERLNVRPRNEGFISGAVKCRFPQLKPVIGYAVTARMRSSVTPVNGKYYYAHPEFWNYLASFSGPRILVILDGDQKPGLGALVGEAYARISRSFGCVACVTNGAVRDLPGIEALDYQVFAGSVAVSHAYAHLVDFGDAVEIGGLRISNGDLLHGDRHGVHMIPHRGAGELAALAEQVLREDRELFELTERKDFSAALLSARLAEVTKHRL
jgi:4-hydroxy-4-methyl-2-oxoglutarate aldolase